MPKTLVVGGYIGSSSAASTPRKALGSEVSIVEMTAGLGVDRDLVAVVAKRLETVCRAIMLETRVTRLEREGDGCECNSKAGMSGTPSSGSRECSLRWDGDRIQRFPAWIGQEVEVDERGFMLVDAQRRTAEPTLFAIGDAAVS